MRQRVVLAVVQRTKGKAQMPANSSATGRRAIVLPPLGEEGGEGSECLDEKIAELEGTFRGRATKTVKKKSGKQNRDIGASFNRDFF